MAVKHNISSYIPDDKYIPVAQMLDADGLLERLKSLDTTSEVIACRLKRSRYNPTVSCLMTYEVDIVDSEGSDSTILLYAHAVTLAQKEKFQRHFNKRTWSAGKVLKQPLVFDNETQVLFEFPNDFKLKAVSKLINPVDLNNLIDEESKKSNRRIADTESEAKLTLLRYKPETRLVLLWESQGKKLIFRCEQPGKSSFGYERLRTLHELYSTNKRIGVPKPLFCREEFGITAMAFVEGAMLPELLRTDEVDRHIARTAETLTILHAHKVADLPVHTPIEVLSALGRTLAVLSSSCKEIETETAYLKSLLLKLMNTGMSEEQGFVHGDFHQGQVLTDTKRDWMLDFDRSHIGDQVADIGNFKAQLDMLELRGRINDADSMGNNFCEAYESSSGRSIPQNNLKFWRGVGLLGQAAKEFRRLKPTWPERIPIMLEKCRKVLEN